MDVKYIQFRVYDEDPNHYIGTANIYQYCNKGIIDSMVGSLLLDSILDVMKNLEEAYGITTIEGYTLLNVARACRITAKRNKLHFEQSEDCNFKGRDFVWITIKQLP